MTREDLTTKQAEKIYAALAPTLGFLNQLEARLEELGLPASDRYVEKLKAAREAYGALTAETLRLTCGQQQTQGAA